MDILNLFVFFIIFFINMINVIGIGVFCKYRHLAPMNHLQPYLSAFAATSMTLYSSSGSFVIIMISFGKPLENMAAWIIVWFVSLDLSLNACFLLELSLLLSFYRTQNITNCDKESFCTSKSTMNKIRRLTMIGRRRNVVLYQLINTIILIVSYTIFLSSKKYLLDEHLSHEVYVSKDAFSMIMIGLGKIFITLIAILVVTWKIRAVKETLGLKTRLKRIAQTGTFCFFAFVIGSFFITAKSKHIIDVIPAVWCSASIYVVKVLIIEPLRESYLSKNLILPAQRVDPPSFERASFALLRDSRTYFSSKTWSLEDFLRSSQGYDAFYTHLQQEFSIENLFLWKATLKYHTVFTHESKQEAALLAAQIQEQYFLHHAPMGVNIDAALIKKYQHPLPNTNALTKDLFDDATRSVLIMVYDDSLPRFLQNAEYSQLWNEFCTPKTSGGVVDKKTPDQEVTVNVVKQTVGKI